MKDFIYAAIPWLAIGLSLAIIAAKMGTKKEKEGFGDYSLEGMIFGLLFGTALGDSFGFPGGSGLCLFVLLGLAIGSFMKKDKEDRQQNK